MRQYELVLGGRHGQKDCGSCWCNDVPCLDAPSGSRASAKRNRNYESAVLFRVAPAYPECGRPAQGRWQGERRTRRGGSQTETKRKNGAILLLPSSSSSPSQLLLPPPLLLSSPSSPPSSFLLSLLLLSIPFLRMERRRVAHEGERPKNRYARFWRATYLRMADCELRQAAFRGQVWEPFAEIGADSWRARRDLPDVARRLSHGRASVTVRYIWRFLDYKGYGAQKIWSGEPLGANHEIKGAPCTSYLALRQNIGREGYNFGRWPGAGPRRQAPDPSIANRRRSASTFPDLLRHECKGGVAGPVFRA